MPTDRPEQPDLPRVPGDPSTPADAGPAGPPETGRRRGTAVVVALLLVVGALLAVALTGVLGSDQVRVEVPAGIAADLEAGTAIELLPRHLEVSVGDQLVIINHDEVAHEVGPYVVAPGQRLEQTFTSPGTIEGVCTLHPSGAITIEVR